MTKFLTTKEMAQELEVSQATVCRWVRDRLIESRRFGERIIKIPRNELDRLLSEPREKDEK